MQKQHLTTVAVREPSQRFTVRWKKAGLDKTHEKVVDLPVSFGREQNNTVVLPSKDKLVSRDHAVIERHDKQLILTDDSKNGTYVNGEKHERGMVQLQLGDEIKIGEWIVDFEPFDNDKTKTMPNEENGGNNNPNRQHQPEGGEISRQDKTSDLDLAGTWVGAIATLLSAVLAILVGWDQLGLFGPIITAALLLLIPIVIVLSNKEKIKRSLPKTTKRIAQAVGRGIPVGAIVGAIVTAIMMTILTAIVTIFFGTISDVILRTVIAAIVGMIYGVVFGSISGAIVAVMVEYWGEVLLQSLSGVLVWAIVWVIVGASGSVIAGIIFKVTVEIIRLAVMGAILGGVVGSIVGAIVRENQLTSKWLIGNR